MLTGLTKNERDLALIILVALSTGGLAMAIAGRDDPFGVRKKPWTSQGFQTMWQRLLRKAEIKGLTFHDLRGSAVVRLALSGCTVPEIISITGHSLRDAETILDKHYLGRDVKLAESAIRKLSRKEKRTKTVNGL